MSLKHNYKYIIVILLVLAIFLSTSIYFNKTYQNSGANLDVNSSVKLPILMFHNILTRSTLGNNLFITPSELESDLQFINENGYSYINMDDLIQFVFNNKSLPQKPILLSFDDGYLNNYVYAYPLFKKYNAKCVLSLIGKSTDDFSEKPDNHLDYSYATWDNIKEMVESGIVEIQNHSYNLHSLKGLRIGCSKLNGEDLEAYERNLKEDIGSFQIYLAQKTGSTPTTFSYPFGYISEDSNDILKKMGFKASLSSYGGVNVITRDPEVLFSLKRNNRPHGISTEDFFKKLNKY